LGGAAYSRGAAGQSIVQFARTNAAFRAVEGRMKILPFLSILALTSLSHGVAQDLAALRQALTFHGSFDGGLDADFSKGDKACLIKKGAEKVAFAGNEEALIVAGAGRFGGALHFPKKGTTRPMYAGAGMLNYNEQSWNASVSAWLRLTPDEDLEPGYCDPIQIVGDDTKKGFIFLEWSKDHTPRFFRYAIRPLIEIWDPNNLGWEGIPFDKRPMVQVANAPFSREKWTHAVFTLNQVNSKTGKASGQLYLNGELQGSIEGWDLRFGWDSAQVALVLGAAYVGYLDDLAVFDQALTAEQVQLIYQLPNGIKDLR
jgi:hypothetical protein